MPPGLTKEGYELQFGTNLVGHALLTKLLLPTLLKTAEEPNSDVRIVSLSSAGHQWTPTGGIVFKDLKTMQDNVSTWARYGQSKLANILYATELARRYPNIKTVSIHPGSVNTNLSETVSQSSLVMRWVSNIFMPLVRRLALVSPEQGAWNQLWAATAPKDEVITGEYYTPVAVRGGKSKNARSEKLAEELWEWTQMELEQYDA